MVHPPRPGPGAGLRPRILPPSLGQGFGPQAEADPPPRRRLTGLLSLQVARWEHKTRKLSRAFGSPRLACYTLGGAILLLNLLRSHW